MIQNSNDWQKTLNPCQATMKGMRTGLLFPDFATMWAAMRLLKWKIWWRITTLYSSARWKKNIIMNSPTNFGGTRPRKTNKIVCLIGLGTIATGVLLDEEVVLEFKTFKGAKGMNTLTFGAKICFLQSCVRHNPSRWVCFSHQPHFWEWHWWIWHPKIPSEPSRRQTR